MDNFQKKIVARALDNPEALSDWEYDFINSLTDKDDANLSEKQTAVLNRILQKLDR